MGGVTLKKVYEVVVDKVYEVVVDDEGHLMVVDTQNEANAVSFPDRDLGQVIAAYRKEGFRHVRENDRDWLIQVGDWVEIRE